MCKRLSQVKKETSKKLQTQPTESQLPYLVLKRTSLPKVPTFGTPLHEEEMQQMQLRQNATRKVLVPNLLLEWKFSEVRKLLKAT